MSTLVFRRANAGDRTELIRFWKQAYLASFPYLRKRHPIEGMDDFYDSMVEKGNEFYIAHDGTVVGMCAVLEGHIQHLYVKTEYQGKGVGTSLLRHVFRSYPSEALFLYVYQQNTEAIELYERLGFRITGDHVSKFEKE